jgi:hypothetical protein
MDETDYWGRLEFRVCREFDGTSDRELQYLWCDGFIPQEYLIDDALPRITGHAWICSGRVQDKWKFTLLLPRPFSSREEIDWASLLPADDVTGWLSLDRHGRRMQMEPAIALPGSA